MSDVIDVLERMGQDAQWSFASQDELQLALAAAEITPELQAAIVAGDQERLQVLLGIAPVFGMQVPAEEEEDENEKEKEKLPGQEDNPLEKLISGALFPSG